MWESGLFFVAGFSSSCTYGITCVYHSKKKMFAPLIFLLYESRVKERLTIPIPTRFPENQVERMDIAVDQTGLGSRSALIKYIVNIFLNDFEKRGIDAFPSNWKEIVESLDGRTTRYEREKDGQSGYFKDSKKRATAKKRA